VDRYDRQARLEGIGQDGQRRLRAAKALVVGVGGLGCPAAMHLAGAGVGTLTICDFDVVDRSNLHRQALYTDHDVGRKKVDVASRRLRAMNPEVHVVEHEERLDGSNALDLVRGHDIVLDCTDDLEAKGALNLACQTIRVPLVFAAVAGWEGQVGLFLPGGPCYRCAHPVAAQGPTCAEEGVLGTLTGILGAMQAQEAIKHLVGRPTLHGRLLLYDARDLTARTIDLKRRPGCECSVQSAPKQPIACPLPWAAPAAPAVDSRDVMARDDLFVLDVRELEEYAEGHIPGARLVPLNDLTENLSALPQGKTIVCVCAVGGRSARATTILREHGYDAVNLRGGMRSWIAAGGPTE
jgi:molybdopterin/thiamine biosynthesis adenylyltransferase/rhodanese-related sulfurtransferase